MAKGGPGFARGVRSPNPIAELDDFISAGRWFEGIVLAGVFLEAWGKKTLRTFFEEKGYKLPRAIEEANMSSIKRTLRDLNLISQKNESKMQKVLRSRNLLVHHLDAHYSIKPEQAKEVLQDAIGVLKVLGA